VMQSFGTVVVDRVADVVFFAIAFGATVTVSPTPGWVRWVGVGGSLLTGVLVAAIAVAAVVMSRRAGRDAPDGRIRRHLVTLGEGLRCVRTARGAARALLLTALAWGVWMIGAWLIAGSLDVDLSATQVLFTTGLLGLGSAVPSAPGFIGTYHWITASALGLFGVGGADALAFAVLLHAAWFIPTTVVGSVLMARWGLGFRALRRTSLSAPAVGA
jgi:glycosyltransferase 2 family protein